MADTGPHLDLATVRIFAAVIEGGDFTIAAKHTGLTRSAVGKAIARLEERIGARLLHRTTRTVTATSNGMAFYQRFAPLLDEIDVAENEVLGGRTSVRGTLRMTMPDAYGRARILPILHRFLARWPEVTAEVTMTDRVLDLIDEGLDLAVRIGPARAQASHISRVIDVIEGVHCASPSYIAERGTPANGLDLDGHDLLQFSGQRRSPVDSDDDRSGKTSRARTRVVYDDAGAIRDATLDGLGIACLPRILVADDVAAGRLVELPLSPEPIVADVRIVYPEKRFLPPRVRHFIDVLTAEMSREVTSVPGGS